MCSFLDSMLCFDEKQLFNIFSWAYFSLGFAWLCLNEVIALQFLANLKNVYFSLQERRGRSERHQERLSFSHKRLRQRQMPQKVKYQRRSKRLKNIQRMMICQVEKMSKNWIRRSKTDCALIYHVMCCKKIHMSHTSTAKTFVVKLDTNKLPSHFEKSSYLYYWLESSCWFPNHLWIIEASHGIHYLKMKL